MSFECPIPLDDYASVTLGHGGGGKLSQKLIDELLLPALDNEYLRELHDGAVLPAGDARLALSTDSFVVHPQFFPGGDIGLLAVHGTTNDLAMCGARPRYLSLALILEEGFLVKDLWRVLMSIRESTQSLGVAVVTGDTKVVERGKGDGLFINTTGVGEVLDGVDLSPRRVAAGDKVLLSGRIADHGMAILSVRKGLEFEGELKSDTAALWPVVEPLLKNLGQDVHVLRDATRGGVASVSNEVAKSASVGMLLQEDALPVSRPARAACEVLGLDPLYVANEGCFVAFVAPERAGEALEILREHPLGRQACVIGEAVAEHPSVVRMESPYGGVRVVDMVSGEQLPRIC